MFIKNIYITLRTYCVIGKENGGISPTVFPLRDWEQVLLFPTKSTIHVVARPCFRTAVAGADEDPHPTPV